MRQKIFNKFRNYYGLWVIIFSLFWLFALVGRIRNGHETNIGDGIEGFLVFMVLAGFIGGIFHFFGEVYRPWRIKRILNHEKLRKLRTYGFSNNDFGYSGKYRNFQVFIKAETTTHQGEWISISVPIFFSHDEIDTVKELSKKYELHNTDDFSYLLSKVSYFFRIPNTEKVLKNLNKFVDDLLDKNIKPIHFIDS